MVEISKQLVDGVVRPYREECRFLRAAFLEYPKVRGVFLIGPTYYHVPSLGHATDIEIQLCLNQLAYIGVAEAIRNKLIPELSGLNFEELRRENMLILESRKRFRRPIKTDVEINGELEISKWRCFNNLILAYTNFQFENRNCFGSLELALTKPEAIKK